MINHEQEFNHPLMSHRKAEFEAWSRIVHHEHPQRLRWLDIGCGCGSLVRHVHRLGQDEIFGSDTGVWAEKAREAGLPIIPEEQLDRYRGQFDLLTAIDVIEHVVEPVDVLRRWRKLLKPGGRLLMVTQNSDIAPRNFVAWSYIKPEIHVSFFNARSLGKALEAAGFETRPFPREDAWFGLVKARTLKNLRISKEPAFDRLIPWRFLCRIIDHRMRMRELPIGIAGT